MRTEVVTADHVVEGASAIDVIVGSDVRRRYRAKVLQHDHLADVAVLEISIGGLRALRLASRATIQEGMGIAAIGYPRAASEFERVDGDALRPSIHAGILSAIRLNGEIYQFDAAVDHGDSGGPVIDAKTGSVIGIVRGSLLDPSYIARGLEQPLPGTGIAMSGLTVERIVRGETPLVNNTDANKETFLSPVVTGRLEKVPPSTQNSSSETLASSAFRIAFYHQTDPGQAQQQVIDTMYRRVTSDLTKNNALYAIPFQGQGQSAASSFDTCQELRVNGYIALTFAWKSSIGTAWVPYVGTTYHRHMNSAVGLWSGDCSGRVIFSTVKKKSENGNTKAWDTEVIDMDNDLIDQAESDFIDFQTTHASAWANFLRTGLFLDPDDTRTYALWGLTQKDGTYRVTGIYPGGPAEIAGVHKGDIVQSIDGHDVTSLTSDEIDGLTDHGKFIVSIKRPEGELSLTVIPKAYAALMTMTGH